MRIALTGNPNSGKTTMFNALTGRSEKTGNWAGVTVDKNESPIKSKYSEGAVDFVAVDLPGAYSMSPYTNEESVTSEYIHNEKVDVIVNIVDATNLGRSLFFTTQLLELGIPVVVALNKSDICKKQGITIDSYLLSEKLGCPVVPTTSTASKGLKKVIDKAITVAGNVQKAPYIQAEIDMSNRALVEEEDRKRFDFINELVSEVETKNANTIQSKPSDKIDKIIMHPFWGIVIFAVVMWLVFFISQTTLGGLLSDLLAGWIEVFQSFVGELLAGVHPLLYSILVDGIIGGVGAVVSFLPLVMIMYFLIALLEDCGYMARATVVLNPIFKKVGLSGKSVIPMIMGTGCGVPAIMSCRTIRDEKERRTAAVLATFMPCGAKLPVIALFAGAFFSDALWVGPVMYFVGVLLILLGALVIRVLTGKRNNMSFFIIELADYKVPSIKFAAKSMLERGKSYLIKAGTVILICNTIIQIMSSFTIRFTLANDDYSDSILALIAQPFSYILFPIVGVLSWQLTAAAITGCFAKENVVGTLATVFALTSFIDSESLAIADGGNAHVAMALGITKVAALAYLMFNLYTPPCVAALAALRAEVGSKRWFWGAIGYQLATGFVVGFLVFQIGTLITTGSVAAGFVPGIIAIVAIFAVMLIISVVNRKSIGREA